MNVLKIIFHFSIVVLLVPVPAECQSGFKKVISYDDSGSLNFDDIQFKNNKIFVSGNAYVDSVGLWGQNLSVFDTNGILVWQKTYLDSTSHIIKNAPARFFICENGNIIVPFYFFNRGNLGLIIIDSIGNKITETEFVNSEFSIYPEEIMEFTNNIYLFGTIQRINYKVDNYIIKTDSNGKFIWIKYYGLTNYYEDFGDVINNNDGTFTISSNRYSEEFNIEPFGSHGWKQPWIYSVDTSGYIVSQWLGIFNDPKTSGGGPFYHTRNGAWIIISWEYKEAFQNGSSFTARTPTITRLNAKHELEWKLYMADFTGFWDKLVDLEYDSIRDEFVAAGHREVYYSEHYSELEAWAVKFTPEGEILWSKSDTIWSDSINGVVHFTAGVDISPTGSIYMAGTIEHKHSPTREFGWILKMTPDGCYDTLCVSTSLKEETKDSEEAIIYPNPTESSVTISVPEEFIGDLIVFYDTFGRVMKKVNIDDIRINVECDFAPGLYFYSIYQDNRLEFTGKLIIK